MCVYLCGGSCIEDVTTHLMKHLSLHPTLRTCSADVYKRQLQLYSPISKSQDSSTSRCQISIFCRHLCWESKFVERCNYWRLYLYLISLGYSHHHFIYWWIDYPKSVSYTHLDVYKRQAVITGETGEATWGWMVSERFLAVIISSADTFPSRYSSVALSLIHIWFSWQYCQGRKEYGCQDSEEKP